VLPALFKVKARFVIFCSRWEYFEDALELFRCSAWISGYVKTMVHLL
jgi:hypothetical protein